MGRGGKVRGDRGKDGLEGGKVGNAGVIENVVDYVFVQRCRGHGRWRSKSPGRLVSRQMANFFYRNGGQPTGSCD